MEKVQGPKYRQNLAHQLLVPLERNADANLTIEAIAKMAKNVEMHMLVKHVSHLVSLETVLISPHVNIDTLLRCVLIGKTVVIVKRAIHVGIGILSST